MVKFVVDSSSLISLSSTCLVRLFGALSENEGFYFYIPESVYAESVERPLGIKRFELNAVRIRDAVDAGELHVGKRTPEIAALTSELERFGNCMSARGMPMRLIQRGETETLALAKSIGAKAIVIDERTTRMLAEDPYGLRKFLQARHGTKVSIDETLLSRFRSIASGFAFVRSSEIVALAYENDLFGDELRHDRQALEAALYAVKFGGCAVSTTEIESYLRSVR